MSELGVHLKPSAYQLDVRPLLREACSKVRKCTLLRAQGPEPLLSPLSPHSFLSLSPRAKPTCPQGAHFLPLLLTQAPPSRPYSPLTLPPRPKTAGVWHRNGDRGHACQARAVVQGRHRRQGALSTPAHAHPYPSFPHLLIHWLQRARVILPRPPCANLAVATAPARPIPQQIS